MPEWFLNLDGGILLWLQEAVRNAVLTPLFTLYTHLGDSGMMWIALSVLLLCFKKTRKAGAGFAAGGELVPFPLLSHPRGPHANPVKRFAWGKGAAAEGVSFAAGGEAKDLELAATLSRCGLGAWSGS